MRVQTDLNRGYTNSMVFSFILVICMAVITLHLSNPIAKRVGSSLTMIVSPLLLTKKCWRRITVARYLTGLFLLVKGNKCAR